MSKVEHKGVCVRGICYRDLPNATEFQSLEEDMQTNLISYVERVRMRMRGRVKCLRGREYTKQNPSEVDLYAEAETERKTIEARDRIIKPLDTLLADKKKMKAFRDGTSQDREALKKPVLQAIRDGSIGLIMSASATGENNTKMLLEYYDETGDSTRQVIMSYGQVEDYTNRLATCFKSVGIKKGDHVAVINNSGDPEILFSVIALQKLGAVTVIMSNQSGAETIAKQLADSDSTHIVAEPNEDVVAAIGSARKNGLEIESFTTASSKNLRENPKQKTEVEGVKSHDFDSLMEGTTREDHIDSILSLKPDDPAFMFFTSGTTGGVKPVVHTNESFMSIIALNTLCVGRRGSNIPIYFRQSGMYGAYLGFSAILAATYTGETRLNTYSNVQQLMKHESDFITKGFDDMFMVPLLIEHFARERADLPNNIKAMLCVDKAYCGTAWLNPSAKKRFESEFFTKVRNRFGATETGLSVVQLQNIDESLGVPTIPLEVIDPDTREHMDGGQRGLLVFSGPTIARGYYEGKHLTEEEREKIRASNKDFYEIEGIRHYVSPDIGYKDEHERVHLVGRSSMVYKEPGGGQIDLQKIEDKLAEDPRLQTAVCVPRTKKTMLSCLKVVCATGDSDLETIKTSIRQTEGIPKGLPVIVEVVSPKEIPRTETMKVARGTLIKKDIEKQKIEAKVIRALMDVGALTEDITEDILPPNYRGLSQTLKKAGVTVQGVHQAITELAAMIIIGEDTTRYSQNQLGLTPDEATRLQQKTQTRN